MQAYCSKKTKTSHGQPIMFSAFFYALRAGGLHVSLGEWMTLMQALDSGLVHGNFTDFYYLCRMLLVKSEADFDQFDVVFRTFFKEVEEAGHEPSQAMLSWLENKDAPLLPDLARMLRPDALDPDEVRKTYHDRLQEQDAPHNEGRKWIGRRGFTPFGNSGEKLGGIRVGGRSEYRSAFQVAGERSFRDFRQDSVLELRQFQVALKRLRQFSARLDIPRTEFNLPGTIDDTCNNGGYLRLRFEKPRKNTVKLLLLMDSGGSMYPFSELCSTLFRAVNETRFFKDVRFYYFHNCVYGKVFRSPACAYNDLLDTEWLLRNLSSDYRLILVGDAAMAPEELLHKRGSYRGINNNRSGLEWLELLRAHFPKSVWLNPIKHAVYTGDYWLQTEERIAKIFPMYELSVDGMGEAMRHLMVAR